MTLSPSAEQGRNGSSLNLSDALGAGLFVGVSGTIFVALRTTTELSLTFGVVLGAMALLALLAALTSLRIGSVRNEFAARVATYPASGPERESLDADAEKIREYVGGIEPSVNGLALVAEDSPPYDADRESAATEPRVRLP